jgi:hypothetical protein
MMMVIIIKQKENKTMTHARQKDAEEMAEKISRFINPFNCPSEQFLDAMAREHPTLQQSFTKMCLEWVEKVAKDDYVFDGRNKASHVVCKKLIEDFDRDDEDNFGLPPSKHLPLV